MAHRRKSTHQVKFARAAKACKGKGKHAFRACMRTHLKK